MVSIAILGHGAVGSGVAELMLKNGDNIAKKSGENILVKHILDLRDFPDTPYADKFTKDFNVILNDADVTVVVEAMGGLHPAYEYVKASLEAGKNAVTSNKELVAQKGAELLEISVKNGVNFMFEASVGGGIPIISPLCQSLAANRIERITGILNGTTNFILTKMIKENMSFNDALKMAQELRYAEADPTADVDGHDTCRKICILASLAFGEHVYPEWVHTEGIRKLTSEDVAYAENADCVVKLIGRTHQTTDCKVFALVSPMLVPKESQLSSVDDVFNAIIVRGDCTGDVLFYGKGAGKYPTASAVISDVIECVKASGSLAGHYWFESKSPNISDVKAAPCRMYVRCLGEKSEIEKQFGEVKYLSRENQPQNELAFITPELLEGKIDSLLENSSLKILAGIRVLEDVQP